MTGAPSPNDTSSVTVHPELFHELNNRIFVIRLGAAVLLEAAHTATPPPYSDRLRAIATAAEEADAIIKRLQAALRSQARAPSQPD